MQKIWLKLLNLCSFFKLIIFILFKFRHQIHYWKDVQLDLECLLQYLINQNSQDLDHENYFQNLSNHRSTCSYISYVIRHIWKFNSQSFEFLFLNPLFDICLLNFFVLVFICKDFIFSWALYPLLCPNYFYLSE